MEWMDVIRSLGGLTLMLQAIGLLALVLSRMGRSTRVREFGQHLFLTWMGFSAFHTLMLQDITSQHWLMFGTSCAILIVAATIDFRGRMTSDSRKAIF